MPTASTPSCSCLICDFSTNNASMWLIGWIVFWRNYPLPNEEMPWHSRDVELLLSSSCADALRLNLRLRNALYHWSRVSMQHDPRSREHYHRLRNKGHSHGRALRGLGTVSWRFYAQC